MTRLLSVLLVLMLMGCTQPNPQILFPSLGATLNNPVHLEANMPVHWYAGDILLGKGQKWSGNLKPGEHIIRAQGTGEAFLSLKVEEDFPVGKIRTIAAQSSIELPAGRYRVIWGNTTDQVLRWSGGMEATTLSPTTDPSEHDLLRPFEQRLFSRPQGKIPFTFRVQAEPKPGSLRAFRLLNLESSGSDTIQAKLVWSGAHTLAYMHQTDGVDLAEAGSGILPIAQDFDTRMVQRVEAAFGSHADVDNNKKVILLFSPRLNASRFAVGFFYAGDLLASGPDNPDSNQAEVLYLGIPEEGDFNFSAGSLSATACHEFQHLVNFSNFTLPYIENPEPPFAPLWLNEGLSHLAEDLCGYNTLGGNLAFVSRYLSKVSQTSLSATDLKGQGDSTERRGAGYLFMRHLLELGGGVVLSGSEIRGGGLEFLHQLLQTRADDLGDIAGAHRLEPSQALWQWWWTLAGIKSYSPRILDATTSDYLGVDLRLGHVQLTPQYGFELEGVKPLEGWPRTLPVHAFALREIVGPIRLEIPPSGRVQVVRLE